MLVLSRKSGEEILIGDDVRLVVSRISGGRVKIAIAAPKTVRVMRGELGPHLSQPQPEQPITRILPRTPQIKA